MKRLLWLLSFISMTTFAAEPADGWYEVKDTISKVSMMSGVDVKTLTVMAAIESSFRKHVSSTQSSAIGLYQFTDRTWRVTLNSYHKKYGLSNHAKRTDAYANTAMAAEYIKENIKAMDRYMWRAPDIYEIYMAHLLSPYRVAQLNKMQWNTDVAERFASLAKYNVNLFYNRDGSGKNVIQFKHTIKLKVDRAMDIYGDLAESALIAYRMDKITPYFNDYKVSKFLEPYACLVNQNVKLWFDKVKNINAYVLAEVNSGLYIPTRYTETITPSNNNISKSWWDKNIHAVIA